MTFRDTDSSDPAVRLSALVAQARRSGDVSAAFLRSMSDAMLRDVSAKVECYRPDIRLDALCEAPVAPDRRRERIESLARVREAAAMMRERFFHARNRESVA